MIVSNRKLRAIVVLLAVALAGLVSVQAVLLRQAWQEEARAFRRNVLSALARTSKQVDALEIAGDATFIMRTTGIDSMASPVDSVRAVTRVDTVLRVDGLPDSVTATMLPWHAGAGPDTVALETRRLTVTIDHDRTRFIQHVVRGVVDTERPPIAGRLAALPLDSLLAAQLDGAGVDATPLAGIVTTPDGSPVHLPAGCDTTAFAASPYRTRLFDLDIRPPHYDLVLVFPGEGARILRRMAPLLGASLVFVVVVVAALVLTVRTLLEQRRFAAQVVDFVNNMTHEFKTPLSTISLAVDAIARTDGTDDGATGRHVRMIREETARMGLQAERILQVAGLARGEMEFAHVPVDGNRLVRGAAEAFALRVVQRGGELEVRTEAARSILRGDEMHLAGLLDNLLDNALKYSPGQPHIVLATADRGRDFVVTVSDRGRGVPSADRERVFEPYYRCPTGDRHDVKGYGLGLSSVRLVARAHGGDAVLEPNPGSGTRVTVTLPLDTAP